MSTTAAPAPTTTDRLASALAIIQDADWGELTDAHLCATSRLLCAALERCYNEQARRFWQRAEK